MRKKFAIVFSLLLALILLLSACATPAQPGAPGAPGAPAQPGDPAQPAQPGDPAQPGAPAQPVPGARDTVVVAMNADVFNLDPTDNPTGASNQFVIMAVYNRLINNRGVTSVYAEPELAESWTISDCGMIITMYLRQGVLFHNGEEFTASDVKFTFERAKEMSALSSMFDPLESIYVIDDFTVQLNLHAPSTSFFPNLGDLHFSILNERAVREAGDDYTMNPVGTGPFKFTEWRLGQSVHLTRFEDYFGQLPHIREITGRVIPDPTTAMLSLQMGEIDFFPNISFIDIPTVEFDPNLSLYSLSISNLVFIGMNPQRTPFNNPLVREAVKLATHRPSIVLGALDGHADIANSVLPRAFVGFDPDVPPVDQFDLERARQLMVEAGFPDGFAIDLCFPSDMVFGINLTVEILQAQLNEIGIRATLIPLETATYLEKVRTNHDFYMTVWRTWLMDSYSMLIRMAATGGANNIYGFSSARVDALLEEAEQAADPAVAHRNFHEVSLILDEENFIVPLFFNRIFHAANSDLMGIDAIDHANFAIGNWFWAS